MNVEIQVAANGWMVAPCHDDGSPPLKKEVYVFEEFEALAEWLRENVSPAAQPLEKKPALAERPPIFNK